MFAKAWNLNFTKKVRILFVESEVEIDLWKRNWISANKFPVKVIYYPDMVAEAL